MKYVTTEKNRNSELGFGDGIGLPIYVINGFMLSYQFNQQHQNNDTFCRPSVVNAKCNISNERFPELGKSCNYTIDKYSPAYGEIVSCFRLLAKEIFLQQHITQKDFIISNNYPDGKTSYNLYIFDTRHHQEYSSAQPTEVMFDFIPAFPAANLNGYSLLLTN